MTTENPADVIEQVYQRLANEMSRRYPERATPRQLGDALAADGLLADPTDREEHAKRDRRIAEAAEWHTKPNPDQPNRCPSIDPYDTLQCTRAIHEDDQCQCGGIGWRKGTPKFISDAERADRLDRMCDALAARTERAEAEVARLSMAKVNQRDAETEATNAVADLATVEAERDELRATVDRVRRETAMDWAGYFRTADSAVGWPTLTIARVIELLESGHEPFGCSAALDTQGGA